MRQINYIEVARCLRRYHATHVNNVTFATFCEEMKKYLNKGESVRLLEFLMHTAHKLKQITPRKYAFDCHQDFFSPDAVRDIFMNYPIQTHFGRQKSAKTILKERGVEVIEPEIIEEHTVETIAIDYSELSDEDIVAMIDALRQEQIRRDELKKRKEQLQAILDVAGVTKEELQELLTL